MKKFLILTLILCVVAGAVGATAYFTSREEPIVFAESDETGSETDSQDSNGEESDTTVPTTAAPVPIENYEYAYAGFAPVYANVDVEWHMLLVNRDYILPDDFEVQLAPSITSDPNSKSLDYRVAPHYNEMYLAALEDGITLTPVSGYRSVSRQKNNFENKIKTYEAQGFSHTQATVLASEIILPPGTSEHNAGLAMDICSLEVNFEETREFAWLCEYASDFGFILRYPKDKMDITNITYEPWHWRYVGVEIAKEIEKTGECYEEYLERIGRL